jgi:hypothetical protein
MPFDSLRSLRALRLAPIIERSPSGPRTSRNDIAPFVLQRGESRAPRVGLEPTTLRLQIVLCFRTGLDYLIIPSMTGVGRF